MYRVGLPGDHITWRVFCMRPWMQSCVASRSACLAAAGRGAEAATEMTRALNLAERRWVGRCRLPVSKPEWKVCLVSAIETKSDEQLSNFAFNCNLRRYSWDHAQTVRQCRLTLSNTS
jgi:hypothetical protein